MLSTRYVAPDSLRLSGAGLAGLVRPCDVGHETDPSWLTGL